MDAVAAAGVLGAPRRPRADRRRRGRHPPRRGPRGVPRHDGRRRAGGAREPGSCHDMEARVVSAVLTELGLPLILRPGLHAGRRGRRRRPARPRSSRRSARARPRGEPDRPGAHRPLARRLGRGRAGGHARRGRQRVIVCSIENIDPMGVHTGDSVTVAPVMTLTDPELSACATRRSRDPRGRRRPAARTCSSRSTAPQRRDGRHRDEPARVAFVGARLQGHRVPDREDRRPAGGGLHARRAAQRDHVHGVTPASFEPSPRLRGGHEDPALRLREGAGQRRPS